MQWCLYIWFYEDNHIIYKITNNRLKYKFKNTTFVKIITQHYWKMQVARLSIYFFNLLILQTYFYSTFAYYRYVVLHITVANYLFMPI